MSEQNEKERRMAGIIPQKSGITVILHVIELNKSSIRDELFSAIHGVSGNISVYKFGGYFRLIPRRGILFLSQIYFSVVGTDVDVDAATVDLAAYFVAVAYHFSGFVDFNFQLRGYKDFAV